MLAFTGILPDSRAVDPERGVLSFVTIAVCRPIVLSQCLEFVPLMNGKKATGTDSRAVAQRDRMSPSRGQAPVLFYFSLSSCWCYVSSHDQLHHHTTQ